MREIISCFAKGKAIIALLEPETNHGGLTPEMIKAQLIAAEDSYAKWGFASDSPRADALLDALFADEPIEWNRIGAFQEVTRKLLGSYQEVTMKLLSSGIGSEPSMPCGLS